LIIDETKCKKDGICVAECPNRIIQLEDGKGFPNYIPDGDKFCIGCGHCVVVCPNGALTHPNISIEDCPPIDEELIISEEQAVQFLRSRRSIRAYDDKPVDKETIQRLIEIARYAPTGANSQLVEWIVVSDKAKVNRLAELTIDWMRHSLEEKPYELRLPPAFLRLFISAWDAGHDVVLRGAPAVVLAMAPEHASFDPTLALSYLEIAATTMGLGTCWAGLLRFALQSWQPARAAMGLPEESPYFYHPMMLGYPKYKYHRLIKRNPPKITWI
jgi:nitroreductase/NAD-dependent dihydropyrimidine dehydrogenase PreA subunit